MGDFLGSCLGSYFGSFYGNRAANMTEKEQKDACIGTGCCCLIALGCIGSLTESKGEVLTSESLPMRIVENYQKNISPALHQKLDTDRICKFTPSCSTYAKEAIEKYGDVKGSYLAAKRLLKCNPLSKGGNDPVK